MSRLTTFIDFNNKQTDHVTKILDMVGVSAQLYRPPTVDYTDLEEGEVAYGVDKELPNATFVKSFLLYLNPKRGSSTREINTDAAHGTETLEIGITQEREIRVGDIIKVKGIERVVRYVDSSYQSKIEIHMERKA